MAGLGTVGVIKRFFEAQPYGRDVTMAEMKALTQEDRIELADLAAQELGMVKDGTSYLPG